MHIFVLELSKFEKLLYIKYFKGTHIYNISKFDCIQSLIVGARAIVISIKTINKAKSAWKRL